MSSTTCGTRILGMSAETTGASAETVATTNSSVSPVRRGPSRHLSEPESVRDHGRRIPRGR